LPLLVQQIAHLLGRGFFLGRKLRRLLGQLLLAASEFRSFLISGLLAIERLLQALELFLGILLRCGDILSAGVLQVLLGVFHGLNRALLPRFQRRQIKLVQLVGNFALLARLLGQFLGQFFARLFVIGIVLLGLFGEGFRLAGKVFL